MQSQQSQLVCCCKLSCNPQVVTPAGAGTAKSSEAAQTGTATAASPSATPGVSQQGQIIGVRTLLEFVAWLVCASLKDSSASTAHSKLRADASPAGLARRGAAFLTEELSSVGVAVRRMQVSKSLPVTSCCCWSVCSMLSGQSDTCHDRPSGRQAASVCRVLSCLSGLLRLLLHADTIRSPGPFALTACAPQGCGDLVPWAVVSVGVCRGARVCLMCCRVT